MKYIAWHIKNRKEYKDIAARLYEYSIPHKLSKEKSLLPRHVALLVDSNHFSKASYVLLRFFGRRSGIDLA